MKLQNILIALAVTGTAMLTSCVTQEKYNEAQALASKYYDDALNCNEKLEAANVKNKELTDELERLKAAKQKMEADTTNLSRELKRVQEDCAKMQEQNMNLLEKLSTSKSKEEVQTLMAEMQDLQSQLIKREDSLFQAERDLADKQKELEEKNKKISELNELIKEKERKMQEIKDKIKNALASYGDDGIQVSTRGGRIYVSLDEQLLFQSGKWDVNKNGEAALKNLSDILAQHTDLNILVEGHTDNVPYNGTGNVIDNWDLSVKRATAVVRILLKNSSVDPANITAAGRGEYCPVDAKNTPEARQKNRRTEIILSPDIDEVLKLIEN